MSPQRYSVTVEVVPDPAGVAVRFTDIEPALRDSAMLEWLLPVLGGDNTALADRRAAALGAGILVGLAGRDLVTYAMEGCP